MSKTHNEKPNPLQDMCIQLEGIKALC